MGVGRIPDAADSASFLRQWLRRRSQPLRREVEDARVTRDRSVYVNPEVAQEFRRKLLTVLQKGGEAVEHDVAHVTADKARQVFDERDQNE